MNHPSPVVIKILESDIWERNKTTKNWGTYLPLFFKKGQPRIVLSYTLFLPLILILHIITILHLALDLQVSSLLLITLSISSLSLILALQKNPGISSSPLPILNIQEIKQHVQYCEKCEIILTSTISHCDKCRVCISHRYHHSILFGRCITSANYFIFIAIITLMHGFSLVAMYNLYGRYSAGL